MARRAPLAGGLGRVVLARFPFAGRDRVVDGQSGRVPLARVAGADGGCRIVRMAVFPGSASVFSTPVPPAGGVDVPIGLVRSPVRHHPAFVHRQGYGSRGAFFHALVGRNLFGHRENS